MANYRRNHYVPQWYQKLFLPSSGEKKFFYLDLKPEIVTTSTGKNFKRKSLLRWGTPSCFYQDDLYTTSFGQWTSTEIEQKFFGRIDNEGEKTLDFFDKFQHPQWDGDHFSNILKFMSVQKLRTPKGLSSFREFLRIQDKNHLLFKIQELQNIFCATWSETIWQIASSTNSGIHFLISDHPVTVYNSKCYPGTRYCNDINDPDVRLNGTYTIFPLSAKKILIMTNLPIIRNPKCDPLGVRPNPGLLRGTFIDMRKIQVDRELSEQEVLRINYIIKSRAQRYIASSKEEWLYPEKKLKNLGWMKLGEDLFMPDPRSLTFGGEVVIGYDSGRHESFDEFGRKPWDHGFGNKNIEEKEWNTFHLHQAEFAKKHGKKRRGRSFQFDKLDPLEDSESAHQMHLDFLKRYRK